MPQHHLASWRQRLERLGSHALHGGAAAAASRPDDPVQARAVEERDLPAVLQLGDGEVRASSGRLGLLRSSNGLSDEQLCGRFEQDGYVFLRGLLPADRVGSAHVQARAELQREGLWPGHKFSAGWR